MFLGQGLMDEEKFLLAHQWSVLAVFLGVCHSLIVEGMVMKKLGISYLYSYMLRFFGGFVIAYGTAHLPSAWFHSESKHESFNPIVHDSLIQLLQHSLYNAFILALKIVLLIAVLIIIMDMIKRLKYVQKRVSNVSKPYAIFIGTFLGITYGAGILIKESNQMTKIDLFFIGTFLMICHAIIEDTLLFVLFGANFSLLIAIRTMWAVILAFILTKLYAMFQLRQQGML
jgi:hypothetical protein